MDIGQEKVARGIRLGALTTQDDFLIPGATPLWRDKRQCVEDAVASKVFFEALIDNDIGRHNEEIGGELRTGHTPFVEV